MHRYDFRSVAFHACTRSTAAVTLLLLSALAPSAATAAAAARRPNVILLMTDDQGYGDLACLGDPIVKTPNMDRLYEQSTRLTDFHVDPCCAPTRAALLTGRYSCRAGVWHTVMGRAYLREDEVTMADVFRAAGYRTCHSGKWHLGHNFPFRPEHRGFEQSLMLGDGGLATPNDYWGNDRFDDTYFRNGKPVKTKGFCTDVFFDNAMDFIRTNKNRPFFVYLPTNIPHTPWNIAEEYARPYRRQGGTAARLAQFYGTLTKLDENLGRLMKLLEQENLVEDTILVFLTDNGSSGRDRGNFNAGMRGHKLSEYDGGHRVPCFIRWPGGGIPAGRDIDRLTAHLDLLPTLIELCGLEHPRGVALDGISLASALRGKSADWPDRKIIVAVNRTDFPVKHAKYAVVSERWRLVNNDELYDMRTDPGQRSNVAARHPEVLGQLREAYRQWWKSVSVRFGEYCEPVFGAEKANFGLLTLLDWHGPDGRRTASSSQDSVRSGEVRNGFWAVRFARDGAYRFALRRWPEEVNRPITGTIPGGKAIRATTARLKLGQIELSKPIAKDAVAVTFDVDLKAGKQKLQTWLVDEESGESRGAYYVYIKRLEKGKGKSPVLK